MKKNNVSQGNFRGKKLISYFIGFFCVLVIVTVYFPYTLIPHPATVLFAFFKELALFTGENLFAIKVASDVEFSSDSIWLYVHLLNLFIFCIPLSIAASQYLEVSKGEKLWALLLIVIRYYLVLQLMIYGWNKIFKWQFYLPEPNTLATPIGNLSKEMVFWSLIGSSYGYSVFAGIMEVIPAIMLLFKRTRIIGALLSFGVLLQVFVMNLSFDISVKFYSFFLLMLSAIILITNKRKILKGLGVLPEEGRSDNCIVDVKFPFRMAFKTIVLIVIACESLYMYFSEGNFNDDKAERPKYHGAYTVESVCVCNQDVKNIYIHRKGYLITEAADGSQKDFRFQLLGNGNWSLTDLETEATFELDCTHPSDTLLLLKNWPDEEGTTFRLHAMDWQNMALLQKENHWFVE
jgi:hypothetical protein